MVENGHRAVYGREAHYPITMDVGALARGLGAGFVRVSRPGDLVRVAELLRNPRGPIVVDVLIDPTSGCRARTGWRRWARASPAARSSS